MKNLFMSLLRDEEGQGMVEYGIIVALIAVVVIASVKTMGEKVDKTYTQSVQKLGVINTD